MRIQSLKLCNVIAIWVLILAIITVNSMLPTAVYAAEQTAERADGNSTEELQTEEERGPEEKGSAGPAGTDAAAGQDDTGPSGSDTGGDAADVQPGAASAEGEQSDAGGSAGDNTEREGTEDRTGEVTGTEDPSGEVREEGQTEGQEAESGEEPGEGADAETEGEPEAGPEEQPEEEPVPTVRITGDDNPNGKWNFDKYNIANHYWTTPLKIKDSNGNTTIAYCGAALMNGSKSESSFKNVWLATDPNIIKTAYYSCGAGASVAQKYFSQGGKGNKWRGGVLLGHFAMSVYVQQAYPDKVPSKYRINLNTWRDKGYVVGGATTTANSKLKAWFVSAVKSFMKDIESREVPDNVKVYLCQSGNSNHQIYYYIVKSKEPAVPEYHPDLSTRLADSSGDDEVPAGRGVILEDAVTLNDFAGYAGQEIRIEGELFDAESGQSTGIKASRTITVDDGDETVTVTFTVDTDQYAGRKLVAAQSAWKGEELIVEHKDLEDEAQTVTIPAVSTHASAVSTGNAQLPGNAEETVVEDIVHYRNLVPGRKYRLTGRLYCRETGAEVACRMIDEDGKEITEAVFEPSSPDGSTALRFAVDTRELAGRTLVTFERLYTESKLLTVHEDPDDEGQTVYVPSVATEAADAENGTHTLRYTENGGIVDLVRYHNLIPGTAYRLKARLLDKSTGETAAVDGLEITAETTFVPENSDGETEVLLSFDATGLEPGSYVACETLYLEAIPDVPVAVHEDPEDEDQTVYVPSISTEASDAETGKKTLRDSSKGGVVDLVRYTGLTPGERYLLKARLLDKSTGETAEVNGHEITAELAFVPETADGETEVLLSFDVTGLKTGSYVVCETLFLEDHPDDPVAVHEDPEDEEQTVSVPVREKKSVRTGDAGVRGLLPVWLLAGTGLLALCGVRKRYEKDRAK